MQIARICLDIGDRRIGIASSKSGVLASAVCTYNRVTLAKDAEYIDKVAKEFGANTIVVGLPVHLDGSAHEQAQKNQCLADRLAEMGYEIVYFDERYTTAIAQQVLISADVSRKKRKKSIDKLAAVIILQGYLDSISGTV